jgi:hypothetical protein
MSFYTTGSGTVFESFAVYADVTQRDSRLFEANEGLTEAIVNAMLKQSSQRLLSMIKATDWWKDYNFKRNSSLNNDVRQLPDVNPFQIDAREQEFKDLNIYHVMSEYILPRVADFGNPDSAEMAKIKFYREQALDLYKIVLEAGDWYDYSNNGTIAYTEREPGRLNLVRVR